MIRPVRYAAYSVAAIVCGILAGTLTSLKSEAEPAEVVMRAAKADRLDAGCARQTWPYIQAGCLERIGPNGQATVTVELRREQDRVSALVRVPALAVASR